MTSHTLVLLRHAKAEPPVGHRDVDRPLSARGQADAVAAGTWLAARGLLPDLVMCSPALRARETWHGVVAGLGDAKRRSVQYETALYTAGADELLELVGGIAETVLTLLVVGHNPTLSMASTYLDPAQPGGGLSTAGLAVHALAGRWAACRSTTAPLTEAHTARA